MYIKYILYIIHLYEVHIMEVPYTASNILFNSILYYDEIHFIYLILYTYIWAKNIGYSEDFCLSVTIPKQL